MAQNLSSDSRVPASVPARLQQVSDGQGKSCCSRPCVPVLLTAILLPLLIAVCRIIMDYPIANSSQNSTTLSQTSPQQPTTLSPSPEEALGCPQQWEKHGRKCYFFNPEKEKKNWNASRKECTALGSDLVVIANKEELLYLMEKSRGNYYFLGLRYSQRDRKWKWINNVDHDPAMFKIEHINLDKYFCTEIGYGRVSAAPCRGHPTTQNMCEKAATIAEKLQKES